MADWVGVDVQEVTFGDPRVPARVWAKFEVHPVTGCWLWTASRNREGYGRISIDGRSYGVHRYMYLRLVGAIGDGLVLDHVCHSVDLECRASFECVHRRCANPDHLEPVTQAENSRRVHSVQAARTHCPSGHEYDEANTRWYRGMRYCRACREAADPGIRARYAERHRDEIRARARAQRLADPEAHRQKCREWYEKNKDYQSARHKEWRAKNPERAVQRVREWRERKRQERERYQEGLW